MSRKRSGGSRASIDTLNAAARAAGFAMVPVEEPQPELRRTPEPAVAHATVPMLSWRSAPQPADASHVPRIVVRGGFMDWFGGWSRKATTA